jgi:hypothetical protein
MVGHALRELIATLVDWREEGDLGGHLACWWSVTSQYRLLAEPVLAGPRRTIWQRLERGWREEA